MDKLILLEKEYSDEDLCDMERDVSEIYDNPEHKSIKKDVYGFTKGTYKVLVTYEEEE